MRIERTSTPAKGLLPSPRLAVLRSPVAIMILGLSLGLASCSGGGGVSTGGFHIETCSLGCTNGTEGDQITCSIIDTYQNQEISILFSNPVDLFSVNSSTFQVVNVANGTSPPGQFFGDPTNLRRLIFRPALSFDQNGNPIFGLEANTSYSIRIPGEVQDGFGPFIQSTTGQVNQARMECTVRTSLGVIDPVPGSPDVVTTVDVVTGYDSNGNANQFDYDVVVTNTPVIEDVWRQTRITFFFDDVMNIATLLDPASKKAPYITIEVDDDGDLATLDRYDVDGAFSFGVDFDRLETYLYFDATLPMPSAGPNAPASPRRVVIIIPSTVQDLVSNSVAAGGGQRSFIPEPSTLQESLLPPGGEDFTVSWPAADSNEDGNRGGAFWGGGQLIPGIGGGSGRLGDLIVPAGLSLTLSTDNQTFPLTTGDGFLLNQVADILGNPDSSGFPNTQGNFPDSITITDGVFEFNSLIVESGGSIRFEGVNPARVYVRGPVDIQAGSVLDLTGAVPADHDSTMVDPFTMLTTPVNAASGGDGGFGGSRSDMASNAAMVALTACENDPVAMVSPHREGYKGMGVGRQGKKGAGLGGEKYPIRLPSTNTETTGAQEVGFNVNAIFDPFTLDTECRSMMVGGSGSGGSYATAGGIGVAFSLAPTSDYPGVTNNAADTPGGDPAEVGLEAAVEDNQGYNARLLRWNKGHLRGGSGGGGGGGHPFGAWADGHNGSSLNACVGPLSNFHAWMDHSGARGGSGGGAFHLTSGKRITVNGVIDASGSRGGEPRNPAVADPCDVDYGKFATPGGGGSGGAVKLQSIVVDLASTPGTIDVSGGRGGTAKFWANSLGGDGGAGLVRIEDLAGLSRAMAAPSILPFDPYDSSLSWVSVDDGQNPLDGPGWVLASQRPDAISASSSCWMKPPGSILSLYFVEDEADPNTGPAAQMGWNMNLLYNTGSGTVTIPFRGLNNQLPNSWENEFGKSLGTQGGTVAAAPIVVRFQGALATATEDYCNLDLNDTSTSIVPGSVTPWVDHPALLNGFLPPPNLMRYVIIFDNTRVAGDIPKQILDQVEGIDSFWVRVLPD